MIDMFMGEYNHTIDAKGRLSFRRSSGKQLGDEFVVTKGLDGCLFVYDNTEWKKFEEKLQALPLTNQKCQKILPVSFIAGASACEVDRQGRIHASFGSAGFCRTREGGCLGRRRKPDRDLEQGDLGGEECL